MRSWVLEYVSNGIRVRDIITADSEYRACEILLRTNPEAELVSASPIL